MVGQALLLLLALEPSSASVAGAPSGRGTNEIELRSSSGAASVRDGILTPLAFTGPGLELSLGYARSIGRGRVDLDAALGLALVYDHLGNPSALAHHELGASYLYPLGGATSAFGAGWALGASARLATESADVQALPFHFRLSLREEDGMAAEAGA